MSLARRSFLTGLAALITAPAIVRAGSLMPVRSLAPVIRGFTPTDIEALGEPPLSGRAIALMQEQARLCEPRLCAMRRWITRAEALEMFPDPHS